MDDIAAADSAFIFLLEFRQRSDRIIHAGFHLNWKDLISGFTIVGNDEVDLNVVSLLFFVIMGVEKKAVSIGNQHLGNGVFIEHAFVQSQLARQDLFVNFVLQKFIFIKGMADQQSRVTEVTFYIRSVLID